MEQYTRFSMLNTAIRLLLLMIFLTGILYPIFITGIAQLCFPWQANGSIITVDNHALASLYIGQPITDPAYFWGRPSATADFPSNDLASMTGSNLGPTNPLLMQHVAQRIKQLQHADPENSQLIPIDLVTTSGSNLDPEISPLAALYQIPRIAKIRKISATVLQQLVQSQIQRRTFYVLGEPRVNVLQLNRALDAITERKPYDQATP